MGWTKSRFVAKTLTTLALVAASVGARATPMTLDFDDLAAGSTFEIINTNLTYGGFRFSSNCVIEAVGENAWASPPGYDSGWIGTTGLCGFTDVGGFDWWNSDFLGPAALQAGLGITPPERVIWIDYHGSSFSLASMTSVWGNSTMRSSKGGILDVNDYCSGGGFVGATCEVSFDGDDWKGIDWLIFSIGSGTGPPFGFDNLTVASLPEPGTLGAFLVALAGFGLSRRRRTA